MNRHQSRPDSVTLFQQARAYRSQLMGLMLLRVVRTVGRRLRAATTAAFGATAHPMAAPTAGRAVGR